MTDPRRFKAPFIPKERIWQETDRLREAHEAGRSLPVKVLDLAEFDLGLDLIPASSLREEVDKQVTKSKPKREYYYEFYLWCPNCSTTYTVESAKKLIEQTPSLL